MPGAQMPIESLAEALRSAYPELDAVGTAGPDPVYLVGGAVRDLLLGRGRADIDLVVAGDPAELAAALGAATLAEHERFATAKVDLDGHELDIAAARAESYPRPGALPVVTPAAEIETDLARRDFTVNAMAIPLRGEPALIDPHGGHADLQAGLLRVLHSRSFLDDPTRAIRAARYAARFGFELETETAQLLARTELETISADRLEAELLRLAAEATAPRGFELLAEWGLVELRPEGVELSARVGELLRRAPWEGTANPDRAILAAATGRPGREVELAAARPERPSEAVSIARSYGPSELVLARALGAEWLEDCIGEWIAIDLEVDGADLIAAGVPQGQAIGRGLGEALRRKLDGEIAGREEELEVALAAARAEPESIEDADSAGGS